MNSSPLFQLLSDHLREMRRSKPALRLGIVLPDGELGFLEALWTHLEARWFEPVLILRERYSETVRASLSDDKQFKFTVTSGNDDCVQTEAIRLIRDRQLDLIVLPPGSGWDFAEELQKSAEDILPPDAAAYALTMPLKLERPLLIGDLFAETSGGANRLAKVARLGGNLLNTLGIEPPRAALLTAVETVSEGIPATVVARQTEELFSDNRDVLVQGPLSLDLAISPHAAEKKKVGGEVAGRADLLIGPNLTVSRGVYQALTCLCEEPSAVALAGGPVPVALAGKCEGPMGVVLSTLFAGILASSSSSNLY